ncbi:hypothetical protein QUA70_26775 [Microcoleus sp. LAD1_D5]|uniref:hypothetical protein n=1 Tax=unclassified Microcoleus TaxID=2642155 RepID=UPI002FCF530E
MSFVTSEKSWFIPLISNVKKDKIEKQLEEVQDLIAYKNLIKGKKAQAVLLRLKEFSYRETEKRLEVSTSFIAQTHRKYLAGNRGIKVKISRLKSYPQRLDFLAQP